MTAIKVEHLTKSFGRKQALDGVNLAVEPGEMVALIGASGSGKSTLLRHIAGLITADRKGSDSTITVQDKVVQTRGHLGKDVKTLRADIGFIFQQFNLVNRLSVLTNVMMGRLGRIPEWRGTFGLFTRDEQQDGMTALWRVGIADLSRQRASTLSGGQQQRAAIARTLVQEAQLILADEPIASLDPASAARVMDTLQRINREDGITVLASLHQVDYAIKYCPRTIALRDGKVVYDGPSEALTPEFLTTLYGAESEDLLLGQRPSHSEWAAPSTIVQRSPDNGDRQPASPNGDDYRVTEKKWRIGTMVMTRTLAGVVTAAAMAMTAGTAVAQMDTFNMGFVSTDSSQYLRDQWTPVLEALEAHLGMEVEPFFASDYAGVIEGMRFNKVHAAWYGNKSAIVAVDRAGGEVFAKVPTYNADTGECIEGYFSHIIAPADSEIDNVEEMLAAAGDLNFGNGDPNSTSGFLVPGYYVFGKAGIDAKSVFANVTNASHESNALAVANGQVDVATNNNMSMVRIGERFPEKHAAIKVIWTSPRIPADPLVWRKDLPADVKSKVMDFFMSYGRRGDNAAEEVEVLNTMMGGFCQFRASGDYQLLPVRQLVLFSERIAVEADELLDEAEKKVKLAELDEELARIAALEAKF